MRDMCTELKSRESIHRNYAIYVTPEMRATTVKLFWTYGKTTMESIVKSIATSANEYARSRALGQQQ